MHTVTTTFEDAYQRHYGAVVASSWSICRDRQVAEELAQEAFARAYRRWRKLEAGGMRWLQQKCRLKQQPRQLSMRDWKPSE